VTTHDVTDSDFTITYCINDQGELIIVSPQVSLV